MNRVRTSGLRFHPQTAPLPTTSKGSVIGTSSLLYTPRFGINVTTLSPSIVRPVLPFPTGQSGPRQIRPNAFVTVPSVSQLSSTAATTITAGSLFHRRNDARSPGSSQVRSSTSTESSHHISSPFSNLGDVEFVTDDGERVNQASTIDIEEQSFGATKRGRHPRTVDDDARDRTLIELVRGEAHLWDHHHADHKSIDKCEESWRVIGGELGLNWEDCKKRWKNLRDSFKRIWSTLPPSGSAYYEAASRVTWPYYRLMEFIRDTFDTRRTSDSWTASKSISVIQEEDSPINNDDHVLPVDAKRSRKRKQDIPNEFSTAIADASRSLASLTKEKPEGRNVADANSALGETIAHQLAYFDNQTQQRLRLKIMRAVCDIIDEAMI